MPISSTPVIAAALRRRTRADGIRKKGGKTKNNYIAEMVLSDCFTIKNVKKAGAPPGNRNALKTGRHTGSNKAVFREAMRLRRRIRHAAALIEAMLEAGVNPDDHIALVRAMAGNAR